MLITRLWHLKFCVFLVFCVLGLFLAYAKANQNLNNPPHGLGLPLLSSVLHLFFSVSCVFCISSLSALA